MTFVVFINSLLLLAMGTLMALNSLLFPANRVVFGEAAILTLTVGALLCISTMNRRGELTRLHSFLLTGSTWITAAAIGAVPLWLWGVSVPDAFFEAMSGITTTGSTVMTGLDGTDRGILLWRAGMLTQTDLSDLPNSPKVSTVIGTPTATASSPLTSGTVP